MWESITIQPTCHPISVVHEAIASTVQMKFYRYKTKTKFQSTAAPTEMFYYLSFVSASAREISCFTYCIRGGIVSRDWLHSVDGDWLSAAD